MACGGAVAGAVGGIVSKVSLGNIPLGIFSVLRTAIATVVFFTIAAYLFGPIHFIDVRTYANKPRNRVSRQDKTAKIQTFSSETRFLRKS